MSKKVTVKNLPQVWFRLTCWVGEYGIDSDFADRLDHFLDELANEDAFGTEGQCDPRGDQRNN